MQNSDNYTTGTFPYASMKSNDPSYVYRDADEQLYQKILLGCYCCVLNSRKTGKSSLRLRTIQKLEDLEKLEFRCVSISIDAVNKESYKTFYQGISQKFWTDLKLENIFQKDFKSWWSSQAFPEDSYSCFRDLIQETLKNIPARIVIFFDEIDGLLTYKYKDTFFTLIRRFFDQRSENDEYERLVCCFLGVATVSDLIENKGQTSYNIGEEIELTEFEFNESTREALLPLFGTRFDEPSSILQAILEQTGGQPFLTRKLCHFVINNSEADKTRPDVKKMSEIYIIDNWKRTQKDSPSHLTTIKDTILRDELISLKLLEIYRRVLESSEEGIEVDDSYEQIQLLLSGLIIKKRERLKVYNPIYREVFDLAWIEKELENIVPYYHKFKQWQKASLEHKQLYLLYGEDLQASWDWKGDKTLPQADNNYLTKSEVFWTKCKFLRKKGYNYVAIIQAIQYWTGGYEIFDDVFFDMARQSQNPPEEGCEGDWIEELAKKLIDQWKTETRDDEAKRKLDTLANRLRQPQNDQVDPFWLLFTYRQLLRRETIPVSEEQRELLDMRLVEEEQEKLQIFNQLYQYYFDEAWVSEEIVNYRLYAQRFLDWLDKAGQTGQENFSIDDTISLSEALEWAYENRDKIRDAREHQFLTRSLVKSKLDGRKTFSRRIDRFRQELLDRSIFPYPLMDAVLEWTSDHHELTELLCNFLRDISQDISNRVQLSTYQASKEEIDKIIQERILDRSATDNLFKQHLKKVFGELVIDIKRSHAHYSRDLVGLLLQYRQIIQGKVKKGWSSECDALVKQELAFEGWDGYLKVYKLYLEYFSFPIIDGDGSRSRLEQQIRSLRSAEYADALIAWIDDPGNSDRLHLSEVEYNQFKKVVSDNYSKMADKEHEFFIQIIIATKNKVRKTSTRELYQTLSEFRKNIGNDKSYTLMEQILEETQGVNFLTEKLCQRILEKRNPIINVEQVPINWKEKEAEKHRIALENNFFIKTVLNLNIKIPVIYRQLLNEKFVRPDRSVQKQSILARAERSLQEKAIEELRDLQLITTDDPPKIVPIYQQLFDSAWLDKIQKRILGIAVSCIFFGGVSGGYLIYAFRNNKPPFSPEPLVTCDKEVINQYYNESIKAKRSGDTSSLEIILDRVNIEYPSPKKHPSPKISKGCSTRLDFARYYYGFIFSKNGQSLKQAINEFCKITDKLATEKTIDLIEKWKKYPDSLGTTGHKQVNDILEEKKKDPNSCPMVKKLSK